MWLAISVTLVLAYFIYYFCLKPYNYWKNRGIIYEIPLPLVGNFGSTLLRKKHVSEINEYLYKKYKNERCVGIYVFTRPALLIRDIDLIKRICVDEFDHFCDRVKLFDKEIDTEIGNILTNLTGKQWKGTRDFLNPVFARARMKTIFDFVFGCADSFASHFAKESDCLVEIQLYEFFSKYENEVISSTCFGVKSDDDFYKKHLRFKNFGVFEKLKLSLIQLVPCIAELFEIQVYPTSKTEYFKELVLETLQKRQAEKSDRRDFIYYLLEAKKGKCKQENKSNKDLNVEFVEDVETNIVTEDCGKEWTDDQIATQALIFLDSHAGMEPLITASSFMAYELALNPDIQVKLQEEIDNTLQKFQGSKVSYEAILEMEYLNCVVSECLRKWPPIYQVDRQCVKNYFEVELPIPDDEKLVIEKGTAVIIPITAIHRDPNYFPDPKRFNPERFNAENRYDIVPGTYIPFGCGPRNCIDCIATTQQLCDNIPFVPFFKCKSGLVLTPILPIEFGRLTTGSQFALLQMKLLLFHLLSKFDLVPTENTRTHLDADPFRFDRHSATQTFLGLKPRKVTSL